MYILDAGGHGGPPLRVNAVFVISVSEPTKAGGFDGIQGFAFVFLFIVFPGRPAIRYPRLLWIPAFAGMMVVVDFERGGVFLQPPSRGLLKNPAMPR